MTGPSIRLGILGATGYTGQCLHALSMHHPCMEVHLPAVRTAGDAGLADRDALAACDVVALALPGEAARAWTEVLRGSGVSRILDLSDAHRRTPGIHYGIPELFGAPPADANLVANPGCYPTATLMALKPLLNAGLVDDGGIAVVGASGSSGAGKSLAPHLHFSELHDNLFPYQVGTHRHIPEIVHHLGAPVSFVTQLLPVPRGILVTAFVPARTNPGALGEALHEAYRGAPYVSVLSKPDQGLGLRHVVGTHQAVLAVGPVEHGGLVPVFGAIDNLMRGAASQALHNINLWFGLEPHLGLPPPLATPVGVPGMKATWT